MATVTLAQLDQLLGGAVLEYWDADDLIGLGEGGSVATWTGQKNALDLVPTGTAPVINLDYATTGFAAVNTAGPAPMSVTNALLGVRSSVICCFLETITPANGNTVWAIGNATNSLQRLRTGTALGQYAFQHQNTSVNLTGNVSEGDDTTIHIITCDYAQATTPEWDRTRFIGRAGAASFAGEGGHDTHVISQNFFMGKRPVDTVQQYQGGFFSIVIVDRTKASEGQMLACHALFESEYGLSDFDPIPDIGGGEGGITPHPAQAHAHPAG